jgi:hypothetical protein
LKRGCGEKATETSSSKAALMELGKMDNPIWDVALQEIIEVDAAALDVHRPADRLSEDV